MTKSILFFFLCLIFLSNAERLAELYWKKQVSLPIPKSIISKISVLSPQEKFSKLAEDNALKKSLPEFCNAAKLLCGHHPLPSDEKFTSPIFCWLQQAPSSSPSASDSFFRENILKEGKLMFLPDIQDKMPPRAFLPRGILAKFPNNISLDKMMSKSLEDCQRVPSKGETKRCVGSLEDMIDFAISVLGRDVVVRTTENLNGSKKKVMVGRVIGINGGIMRHSRIREGFF